MTEEEHANVSLLKRVDLGNLAGAAELFAEDFVWHFFNPRLPDVQGDYLGLAGLQTFFEKLGAATGGTFQVEPISITPAGDELVVTHVRDRMVVENMPMAIDAVVVWRMGHTGRSYGTATVPLTRRRWRPPQGSSCPD